MAKYMTSDNGCSNKTQRYLIQTGFGIPSRLRLSVSASELLTSMAMCSSQAEKDQLIEEKMTTTLKITEEIIEPRQPHEAFFLVLSYLNLFELLTINQVCTSMRDAVRNDVLVWLDIIVEPPLSSRITDEILLKYASKSLGRLRTLALKNCARITDAGLLKVIEINPHISKLYLPGCSQLTADGILIAVKRLTEQEDYKLKYLILQNINNITKDHLQVLQSCLKVDTTQQKLHRKIYLDNAHHSSLRSYKAHQPIDIEICPKCNDIGLVFDCPRQDCESKNGKALGACRGCIRCIPRCEGCGGCVDLDETGETICSDLLCLDCWLKASKCSYCNKPYCHRHVKSGLEWNPHSGFLCDVCTYEEMIEDEGL